MCNFPEEIRTNAFASQMCATDRQTDRRKGTCTQQERPLAHRSCVLETCPVCRQLSQSERCLSPAVVTPYSLKLLIIIIIVTITVILLLYVYQGTTCRRWLSCHRLGPGIEIRSSGVVTNASLSRLSSLLLLMRCKSYRSEASCQ